MEVMAPHAPPEDPARLAQELDEELRHEFELISERQQRVEEALRNPEPDPRSAAGFRTTFRSILEDLGLIGSR